MSDYGAPMEKVFDSKKTKLTMQDIIIHRIYDEKDRLPMPPEQVIMLVIKELEMPRSEAITFGNTVFISHYSEDGTGAMVRMLNVDTAKNLQNNGELFVRHLKKQKVKNFLSQYDFAGYAKLFERLQKRRLGRVQTKQLGDGSFVSFVELMP